MKQVANSDKATWQLQHAGRQKIGFSKSNFCFVSCETLLLGKPLESGSAESLRCLPRLQFAGVAFSELLINLSRLSFSGSFFAS